MTPRARRRLAVIVAFAVLVAIVLIWLAACGPGRSGPSASDSGSGSGLATVAPVDRGTGSFEIHGSSTLPLSPGVTSPVDVAFVNTHDRPMRVTGIRVTIESVSAPRSTTLLPCTVGDFAIDQTDAAVDVPAGDELSLSAAALDELDWPQLTMLETGLNQDGCLGARLELSYDAIGQVRS